MTFSVTQFGKKLSKDKYTWNENTRTFLTAENNLVLDFSEYDGCTFNTGYSCTVETGDCCMFRTGGNCTFKTGYGCTFDTGDCCTFDTGNGCTFDTGYGCVVIRRDVFEVIQPEVGTIYKLCPWQIKGYLTKKRRRKCFLYGH